MNASTGTTGQSGEFDPVACMRQIVLSSGVSIEEIARQANLNSKHLESAIFGTGQAKLGLEEARSVCKVLNTDALARAWARSVGLDLYTLPPPQNSTDDPVVHIRASMGSLAQLLMVTSAIDLTGMDKSRWLTNLVEALGTYLEFAAVLSSQTSVSRNELRKLHSAQSSLSSICAEFPFPRELFPPLAQTMSNVLAALNALEKFAEPPHPIDGSARRVNVSR